MAAARKIVKKRVGPQGVEIDCDDDQDKWVDIKETKRAKYEQARGFKWRRTIYNHNVQRCERRKYDDDPKITFKDPDDEGNKIEYLKGKGPNHGTVKSIMIEAGRGRYHQATKLHFENTRNCESTRKIRVQTVENEDTGDTIKVERIERWTNEWGTGRAFQKKNIHPCSTEKQIKDMDGPCKFNNEQA